MNNQPELCVLSAFRPFLRILNAFNSDSFHSDNNKNSWFIRSSVFCAFGAILIGAAIFNYFVLIAWYLFENGANLEKCMIAVPILVTLLQLELTFIALVGKNTIITETIEQLHGVINQRK